jgi:site-specific DNA-methyltransferase (adenine-specific)
MTENLIASKPMLGAVASQVFNEDCVEALKRFSDNHFDLAIVDPPYGIGEANEKRMQSRHHSQRKYKGGDWDNEAPSPEYFSELMRVSKNQIIWGANHFIERIPINSSCWVFWDKDQYGDFADGELAWTSFKTSVRKFKWTWNGFRKQQPENRIHPTQKPVALYEWLLHEYGAEANLILDTHVGSGSSRIACHKAGKQFVGYEIDKDYWNGQEKRFNDFVSQLTMF